MTDKPSVLFVCVHNAGRSQMAVVSKTNCCAPQKKKNRGSESIFRG